MVKNFMVSMGHFFLHQITYLAELPGELRLFRLGGMGLIGNTLEILDESYLVGGLEHLLFFHVYIYIYIGKNNPN